jgi:DNA-binding transcriptional regulator YhcF (GntR family)
MRLTIDAASAVPPFEQVRSGVLAAVASGELVSGSRLPTVRALAEQLGIAVNTVARSYRELETDGIIETRGRSGSFVCASGDYIQQRAQDAARTFVETVDLLGVGRDDALALVAAALRT